MAVHKYSMGTLPGVDASFCSLTSTSSSNSGSYEIETEVGRDALVQICCSVLSRLLDFPDSQLETLLGCDDDQGQKEETDGGMNVAKNLAATFRSMKHSINNGLSAISNRCHPRHGSMELLSQENPDRPSSHPTLQFGVPMTTDGQVVLIQLITHVVSFSSVEGLFRKPGNKMRVEQLVQELGEQYFADLPEPLMLSRHIDAYIQAADLSVALRMTQCLQLLTLMLPPQHRMVLQHLLELLSSVASYEESRMDAYNLALVFAPTLFWSSKAEAIPPLSLQKLSTLLKHLIENHTEAFEVPSEVQVVAERYGRKSKSGEADVAFDVYRTSCQRMEVDSFHAQGQQVAGEEVKALLEYVQKMPEGPQKAHFMKRFEAYNKAPATPSQDMKQRKFHRNKENFFTPKAKVYTDQDGWSRPNLGKETYKPKDDLLCMTPNTAASFLTPNKPPPKTGHIPFLVSQSPFITDV
ncbi:hypothetical protein EMCRGX_G029716 [Ephydatia muelleri]